MPANDIRVGGVRVDVTANAGQYSRGMAQASQANRRFNRSFQGTTASLDRFRNSITSSHLATAAYAAGVAAVSAAFGGTARSFIRYETDLIAISKTTGIVGDELERLGERLTGIITFGSGELSGLGLLREDLFSIAVAAGQAGIQSEEGIVRLARAAAALQSSSDLVGTDAVRSLTRYLEVTGQGIDAVDRIASGFTHLGNNIVGTESEISEFARRLAQDTRAVAEISDSFILGLSAAFVSSGARLESASTVMQRALAVLNTALSDGDQFHAFARAAGVAEEASEALRQRFVDGTASMQDTDQALLILLQSLSRLPQIAEAGQPTRGSLLELLFGGKNVRVQANLGLLLNQFDQLEEHVALASEGLDSSSAHYEEANRAAEAYGNRLRVVRNELAEQGRQVGETIVPALTALAENFRSLELLAITAGGAIAGRFASRAARGIATVTAEVVAAEQVALARAQRAVFETRTVQSAASSRAASLSQVALFTRTGRAQRQAATATRDLTRATRNHRRAQAGFIAAQRNMLRGTRRLTRSIGRFGLGLTALAGGPAGLVVTALIAAAGAVLLFGSRTDETTAKVESLVAELDLLIDQRRNTGLDSIGEQMRRSGEAIAELEDELEGAQERLAALQTPLTPSGFVDVQQANAIFETILRLSDQAVSLRVRQQELRQAYGRAGEAGQAAAEIASSSFERLAVSLQAVRNTAIDFSRGIAASNAEELQRLDNEIAALQLLGEEREVALAVGQRRIEIDRRLTQETGKLYTSVRSLADQQERVAQSREAVQGLALGSEALQEAENALAAEERREQSLRDTVAQQRELVSLLGAQEPAEARITHLIRERTNLQIARLRATRPEAVVADINREVNAVEDLIRATERELEVNERLSAQQLSVLTTTDPVTAEVLRREYEILNSFLNDAQDATDRVHRATRDLYQEYDRLTEVNARLSDARREDRAALLEQRNEIEQNIEALRAEQEQAVASRDAYESRRAAVERISQDDSIRRQTEAQDLLRRRLELVSRAANRVGDEFVSAFETSRFSVENLASAIAGDLIRALIQSVITANLLQAALSVIPGIGGLFGGTAAVQHSGGPAGKSGQFRSLRAPLRHDELYAILQRGEAVVPRWLRDRSAHEIGQWVKSLPRYHRGGVAGVTRAGAEAGRGGGQPVNVNVINQGTRDLEVVNTSARVSAEGMVLDILVTDARKGGKISQVIKQIR